MLHSSVGMRTARAALCVLMITPVFNTAAWADSYVYQGKNYAVVGKNLKWVGACDMEQDGNGVYGQFKLTGPGREIVEVSDPNGSAANCGNRTFDRAVIEFRVCERQIGRDACSNWEPANP
jgi:hypothetical protein